MKAAIVGLGKVGWKFDDGFPNAKGAMTHLSALRRLGIEVVAGFDISTASRSDFSSKTGIAAYSELNSILKLKPDIVTIASPNQFHQDHLIEATNAKVKFIWLEKPATANCNLTESLISKVESKGARVLVGFQRRYMENYATLKDDTLGDIIAIEGTYSRGIQTNGIHLIDLLVWILGDRIPELVSVSKGTFNKTSKEYSPSFFMTGAGDIPISVTGINTSYNIFEIAVYYKKGKKAVRWGGMAVQDEIITPHPFFPGFYTLDTPKKRTPIIFDLSNFEQAFPRMLDDLLNGESFQPRSNLKTAYLGECVLKGVLSKCE